MTVFRLLLFALMLFPSVALADRALPVDGGTVTSGVGWRLDPFGSGRMLYHRGYDIAVPTGTPVYPVRSGRIYYAGPYKGYGNLVAVDHGNGYMTLYGHNSALKVTNGQRVDSRTVIALAGSTGRSTGPHVHFEIRQLAGYDKRKREQLRKELKAVVESNIHEWVDGYVSGKGGDETELSLPTDIDE